MKYLLIFGLVAVASCLTFLVSAQTRLSSPEPKAIAQVAQVGHYGYAELASSEELDEMFEEIGQLRSEVAYLSTRISQLQGQEHRQSTQNPQPSAKEGAYFEDQHDYSVADRFEYGDQSSQSASPNDSNMEGTIYASASPDLEVYSTECRGSLCKVYVSSSTEETYETESNDEFIASITDSLEGNVNIYFDEEGGQQVIYVESVD